MICIYHYKTTNIVSIVCWNKFHNIKKKWISPQIHFIWTFLIQDIKHMKEQLRLAQADTRVAVQCELANEAHDMLMGESTVPAFWKSIWNSTMSLLFNHCYDKSVNKIYLKKQEYVDRSDFLENLFTFCKIFLCRRKLFISALNSLHFCGSP